LALPASSRKPRTARSTSPRGEQQTHPEPKSKTDANATGLLASSHSSLPQDRPNSWANLCWSNAARRPALWSRGSSDDRMNVLLPPPGGPATTMTQRFAAARRRACSLATKASSASTSVFEEGFSDVGAGAGLGPMLDSKLTATMINDDVEAARTAGRARSMSGACVA